jgi:C-terminal processing protease CtpA/Prc
LDRARGVIIDLRYNGGGDDGIAFTILKHFIQDTVLIGSSSTIRILNPYLKAIGRYVNVADTTGNADKRDAWLLYNGYAVYDKPGTWRSKIDQSTHKIRAPVVILIGKNTASAAEDFLIASSNQKHIVTVGEPTNGSTGMPYRFDLPGGGSARICVKKDMYPDGREFVGYGIQPNISVVPGVKDYLENKDVVLEAALQYFKKKHQLRN